MKRRILRGFVVWLCAVSAYGGALSLAWPGGQPSAQQKRPGQATPANSPTSTQPVIRTTTRLVQVSVIVQDKRGKPVADLNRDDFAVFDSGQEQPVSVFSVESSRVLPRRAEPLPPNTFSNRLEQRGSVPTSVTVILLDGLNTRFVDQAYAKQQIIKFLGQLQPQDRVALYTLGRDLRILHDFTSDATPLLRALGRFRGRLNSEVDASEPEEASSGDSEFDAFLNEANQRVATFYQQDRARRTSWALETIANHVARLPGRKNLIWVSSSFPFNFGPDEMQGPRQLATERGTFSEEVERAARALNNANLAIYPVDARGLIGPFPNPNFNAPTAARGAALNRPNIITLGQIGPTHDTMQILAQRTGGRAFYNTNDIQGAIRRAIEDSAVTYTLGYYPAHNQWNGRFREIKVRVKRPGINVRHRRGYFALPEQQLDEKQRQAALRDAATSPLDASALGLTVRAVRVDVPGAESFNVELEIEPRGIALEQQGDRWVGELDIIYAQLDAEGRFVSVSSQTLGMRLSQQKRQEVLTEGLLLSRTLSYSPNMQQLRVVVRDSTSGAIGSVSIPVGRVKPAAARATPR